MEIKIICIRARADGSGVVLVVTVRGDEGSETRRLPLTDEQYLSLHPKKGEITPEAFEALEAASSLCRALSSGTRMLGASSHSAKDLERRLRQKGSGAEEAKAAVEYLTERGYIREGEDATREAERCLHKNWSERHIVAHLFEKGYGEDVVRRVREELLAQVDFAEVCAKVIDARWRRNVPDEDGVRKTVASLMRAGFTASQIKEALRLLKSNVADDLPEQDGP